MGKHLLVLLLVTTSGLVKPEADTVDKVLLTQECRRWTGIEDILSIDPCVHVGGKRAKKDLFQKWYSPNSLFGNEISNTNKMNIILRQMFSKKYLNRIGGDEEDNPLFKMGWI